MITKMSQGDGAYKVMAILEILGAADQKSVDGLTVAEVARRLDRDKSVASRQLKHLADSGLIERDERLRYRLSWRLFAIAAKGGDQRLIQAGIPMLRVLAGTLHERAHLTVLSGYQVLTVHSEGSSRALEAVGWVGRLTPVWNTSSGIALVLDRSDEEIEGLLERDQKLSRSQHETVFNSIARAREEGYSISDGLFDADVLGVAAPVRDQNGRIVAAVNISGPVFRVKPQLHAVASHLMAAARKLSLLNQ
ncbi:IclR family transcriptional regulator [Parafrigoribacterium mesophilum]|uniref:IclR family transcriptional regulator n=1 Tax=Parafrigoribacterium mesophilum TaxID=433646 RepID=UPI0031FC69D1